jgi:diguanylate cyclase (GGDEF)-like protein
MGWLAAFVAWQLWGGIEHRDVVSDLASLPLWMAAVVTSALAARAATSRSRTRRAWTLITVASGLYLAGDALWAYYEVVRHQNPFPSLADPCYLAFYPVLLAGLLSFPVRRSRADLLRLGLDMVTVVVAGAMAVWYFALGPTLTSVQHLSSSSVLSVAYPVGDLALVLGSATTLLRGMRPTSAASARGLMVGLGAFVVADVGFAHLNLINAYHPGSWPDTFWMLAAVCWVAAAEHHRRTAASPHPAGSSRGPVWRISPLPYAAVAASYLLLLVVASDQAGSPLKTLLVGALVVTAAVVVRQFITMRENVRLVEQFHELATTDSLTGLASRRHILDIAERSLIEGRRRGEELSIIMVDVDHFKVINDQHGHDAGDEALKLVATRCAPLLRAGDVMGRFGGDEFVVLLPRTSLDGALALAERLRSEVSRVTGPLGSYAGVLSLSLGVASSGVHADLLTLLRAADAGLYAAKKDGRGCVRAGPAFAVETSALLSPPLLARTN